MLPNSTAYDIAYDIRYGYVDPVSLNLTCKQVRRVNKRLLKFMA